MFWPFWVTPHALSLSHSGYCKAEAFEKPSFLLLLYYYYYYYYNIFILSLLFDGKIILNSPAKCHFCLHTPRFHLKQSAKNSNQLRGFYAFSLLENTASLSLKWKKTKPHLFPSCTSSMYPLYHSRFSLFLRLLFLL